MKPPVRITLGSWLTVPYVALVTGVALLIGLLSYRAGSQAVDTVADNLLLETVARIGQAIDRHVVGSAATLETAFPVGLPAPTRIETELTSLRTRFWIATSLNLDPNNYVYYANRQGQFIGLWRHSQEEGELRLKLEPDEFRQLSRFKGIYGELSPPNKETKVYEPRSRPWYEAAISKSGHTWSPIYVDFRKAELVATRARSVVDMKGNFQGVVATDISLNTLNEFVRSLKTSSLAIAFIIEPDGNLIASSRTANVQHPQGGRPARLSVADSGDAAQVAAYVQVKKWLLEGKPLNKAVTQRFEGPDGEVMQLAFDRLRDDAGLDWIMVVAMPRSDFMSGVTSNLVRTTLIGAAGAGAALALGLGIMGWITRDLRRLAEAAREIGAGRLDTPLNVHRSDEIGDLANTFRQMQHQLSTDNLTGLVNRDALLRSITARIQQPRRADDDRHFAVLFIDLDDFKLINDRLGHAAGDQALIEFGARLRNASRVGDLVARYAGDEFVMLVDNVENAEAAEQVRTKIEGLLRDAVRLDVDSATVGGTVGVAAYPWDGQTAEELVQRADADMYSRKRARRSS